MGRRTTASVVPSVVSSLKNGNDEFVSAQVDQVEVRVYRHRHLGDQSHYVVVDIEAPAGQELVITVNDGDVFRGVVPE